MRQHRFLDSRLLGSGVLGVKGAAYGEGLCACPALRGACSRVGRGLADK